MSGGPAAAPLAGGRTRPASAEESRSRRVLDVARPVLAVITEGAWIATVYAVLQGAAHVGAPIGIAGMAIAAAIGLLLARRWGVSLGAAWPRVAVACVLAAALIGWLSSPIALERLLALDLGAAIRANPGGFLVGLAVLRGMAHVRPGASLAALEHVMEWGLPGLVIPVLVAGMLPEPWRGEATGQVVLGIVVFLVAGTIGLAIGRQASVGGRAGFDWRRNRAWLGLVGLLAVGVVLAALPASLVVGPVVRIVLAATFLPLMAVGMLAGLGQISRRAVVSILVLLVAFLIVLALAPPARPTSESEPGGVGGATDQSNDPTVVALAGGGVLVLVVVGGVLVLARLWMREALRPTDDAVVEERVIDQTMPEARTAGRWRRAPTPAPGTPDTAAEAYVALLRDLEPVAARRRAAAESPAEHARRLRETGNGAVGLDLLAADYELTVFGGRTLTSGEEQRGIARWRRLRRSLRA